MSAEQSPALSPRSGGDSPAPPLEPVLRAPVDGRDTTDALVTAVDTGNEATTPPDDTIAISRLTLSGIKHALAERRAKKAETELMAPGEGEEHEHTPHKIKRADIKYELRAFWGEVAAKDQSFGEVQEDGEHFKAGDELWPITQKEEAIAQRAFRARDHQKVVRATMRVAEGGTYQIDPETGKSKQRRKDPELKKVPKATRKSIEKEERKYKKLRKKIDHANHILHPHHDKKHAKPSDTKKLQEKAQKKRKKADGLKVKAQTTTLKREVGKLERRAFVGEVAKAWRGRTDTALEHREKFYEDLARVANPATTDDAEIMNVRPFEFRSEGGLIERAARKRVARQKKMMEDSGEANDAQSTIRHKNTLERRVKRYRTHKSTTRRRKNNTAALTSRRAQTDKHYQNLRQARQQLHTLRRPSQS
jgi:hypothetical protein